MGKRKFVPRPDNIEQIGWPVFTVLGLDPSMAKTGWSIIEFRPNSLYPIALGYGTVRTESNGKLNMQNIVTRCGAAAQELLSVIHTEIGWRAIDVAIELPVPTSMGAGSQAGSLAVQSMYTALTVGPPKFTHNHIGMYAPNTVKKAVALNGRAEKSEVKAAVFKWLGIEFRTNTDVTDSIAVAIKHALTIAEMPSHEYIAT